MNNYRKQVPVFTVYIDIYIYKFPSANMVVADIVCVVTSAVEQDSHSLKPNHDYIHAKTIHIVCSFALSLEPGKPNNKQSPKSSKKNVPTIPKCYMVGL